MESDQSILTLALITFLCDGASKPMRKKIIKKAIVFGQYNAVSLLDEFYAKPKMAAWHVVALDCAEQARVYSPELVISSHFRASVSDKVSEVDGDNIIFDVAECQKEIDSIFSSGRKQ